MSFFWVAAYRCDFFPLPFNSVSEILLHHAHCHNTIIAQRLDDLQRRQQAILIDFLQDGVQLFTCLLQDLRVRGKVRQRIDVQLRLLRSVFPQRLYHALRVSGGCI